MVSGQQHAPAALYPRKRPGTHFTGGWVGPRSGPDGRKISSPPGFDAGSSSPFSVTIPTELLGLHIGIIENPKSLRKISFLSQFELKDILLYNILVFGAPNFTNYVQNVFRSPVSKLKQMKRNARKARWALFLYCVLGDDPFPWRRSSSRKFIDRFNTANGVE